MSYTQVFNELIFNDAHYQTAVVSEHHLKKSEQFKFMLSDQICSYGHGDVLKAIKHPKGSLTALKILLSPAAEGYIEQIAQLSEQITRQRFGANIHLFIPLYLSNLCANECDYCGFSMGNKIKRKILTDSEIINEINIIKSMGFDSVLLVTGEHQTKVGINYFEHVLPIIKSHFNYLAMEVQPLTCEEYKKLHKRGLDAVMVYQETYFLDPYLTHHIKGKKNDFYYRLQTPERVAQAGIDKIGLGVLLGLSDWRADSWMMGHHLSYMQKHYWRNRYSISVPRLRPCVGGIKPETPLTDKQLLQLICAFRLVYPELEISLSTREVPSFRDGVLPLGITNMSAASCTEPGGYSQPNHHLSQFDISDDRSINDVLDAIKAKELQPVFKDWQGEWSTANYIY